MIDGSHPDKIRKQPLSSSGVLTNRTGKRERVSVHIPSVKVMIVKVEAVTERI